MIAETVPQSKINDAQVLLNRLTCNALTPQQMDLLTTATIEELGAFEGLSILSVDLKGDVLLLSQKQDGVVQDVMTRMLNDQKLPANVKDLVKQAQVAHEKAKATGLSKITK